MMFQLFYTMYENFCSNSHILSFKGQAVVSSFIPFLIFGILTGFITGGTVVISVAVMIRSVGAKRYPSSIGLTCFIQGWFALFGGPLVGKYISKALTTIKKQEACQMPFIRYKIK